MLSDLPLQDELAPSLSVNDLACLTKLKEVLEAHGAEHRFGVTLLHRHFPIAGDEVVVEYLAQEGRSTVSRIERTLEAEERSIATGWRLDHEAPVVISRCAGACHHDNR